MAKRDKKLYDKLRASGVRKRVARDLSMLPLIGKDGKQAPKAARDAVAKLESIVSDLKQHAGQGDRKAAARKAARTRQRNAAQRSASARKAAKTRARS